jgi:hypothetical protein
VPFPTLSPAAAYALLAGVALAVVLLHLLRPRAPARLVGSAVLWRRVLQVRPRRSSRWRWWLSLALALAIALSLALALITTDPATGGARRSVLILDNAPSMAARTRDGRTRWQHALARARAVVDAGGAVMVLDTMGYAPAPAFVEGAAAREALEQIPLATFGTPRLPPVPPPADSSVHVFSDGVTLTRLPDQAMLHDVFEAADNVAITAFDARPMLQDPTRIEVLVQILNASPGPKRVRLALRGGADFRLLQPLEVGAGELIDATFDVSAFAGGVLAAAVAADGDAFALDDIAYALVPAHAARRVLLVSADSAPLADALRALPGVELTTVAPAAYAGASRFDIAVFDRFAPAALPAAALLFGAPGDRFLTRPAIGGWDGADPIMAGVAWHDLRLQRARAQSATGDTLLWSGNAPAEPLIVAVRDRAARAIRVGFTLQDSNFGVQGGLPVFLGQALAWLADAAPAPGHALGPIEVALERARVTDGTGRPLPTLRTARGTLFEANRPDVYTATAGASSIQICANLTDPRVAQINWRALGDAGGVRATGAALARWTPQRWQLLTALAALLLLAEWIAYVRKLAL